MRPPTPEIYEAFGLVGPANSLQGGRGLCYLVGDTVLKPSDDDTEIQWISKIATRLLQLSPTAYRLSKPLPVIDHPTTFVFKGWFASSYVSGTPISTLSETNLEQFKAAFDASHAFHADLAALGISEKPLAIETRFNRWDEADKVTWGETTLDQVAGVNKEVLAGLQSVLDDLSGALKPIPDDIPRQLIHGDLTGNVLFSKKAPAVIDLTFYWHPAEYAEAIVVADGLAWHGAGQELIKLYGTDDFRLQLLFRAMYWRCLTFAIDPDVKWIEENLPKLKYRRAMAVLFNYLKDARGVSE